MKGYHPSISDVTGVMDERELQEIEELMRLQTGGVLDHLDKQWFKEVALVAVEARKVLARDL